MTHFALPVELCSGLLKTSAVSGRYSGNISICGFAETVKVANGSLLLRITINSRDNLPYLQLLNLFVNIVRIG